jgi:ubiquinone/menaquinone biosynthesis C-methylase UbiE
MSSNPRREHPSTYIVQDRDNHDEFTRLQVQDQVITAAMGGVLPEQPNPTSFKRILDIGCGTGGWLIETAKTYPEVMQLFGIDISGKMLDYARTQAEANQINDRIEFIVMDALRMLEFPTGFFDLVNMRFAEGWIRIWEWPKLLQEAQRVSKPGGAVRFTEVDFGAESSSPALNRFTRLHLQALHQAGYAFTPNGDGITSRLAELMHQHGMLGVQTRTYTIEYRAGTPEGQLYSENIRLALQTITPFLKKWIRLPDDYEDICQQTLIEMQASDFVARWQVLTAWGTNEGHQVFFSEQ